MNESKRNDIKVGDMVECIAYDISCKADEEAYARGTLKHALEIGKHYTVMAVDYTAGYNFVSVVGNGVNVNGTYMNQFRKNNSLTNKNHMSNIVNLIKKLARKEPEKTFIEVGFMDEAENITDDGKEALFHLLWKEKKEALKELADEIENETNR